MERFTFRFAIGLTQAISLPCRRRFPLLRRSRIAARPPIRVSDCPFGQKMMYHEATSTIRVLRANPLS
jgi:hypothetical protein